MERDDQFWMGKATPASVAPLAVEMYDVIKTLLLFATDPRFRTDVNPLALNSPVITACRSIVLKAEGE